MSSGPEDERATADQLPDSFKNDHYVSKMQEVSAFALLLVHHTRMISRRGIGDFTRYCIRSRSFLKNALP